MQVQAGRLLRLATAMLVAMAMTACQGGTSGLTLAEAQTFLGQITTMAQQGNFEGLCAVGDGNCARELASAGRANVPAASPRVIASRTIASTNVNGQQTVGGIVLTVCGVDGRQVPYRSELLVFQNGSTLAAINTIYWDGITIGDDAQPVTPPSPPTMQPGC